MDWESAFKLAVAICGALVGLVLKNINQKIDSQTITEDRMMLKIQAIELLIVGDYVKKEDLKNWGEAVFNKLDRIENKLDGKVDKP